MSGSDNDLSVRMIAIILIGSGVCWVGGASGSGYCWFYHSTTECAVVTHQDTAHGR